MNGGAVVRIAAILLLGTACSAAKQVPDAPKRPGVSRTVVNPAEIGMFARGDYQIGVQTHFPLNRDMGYDPAPVARSVRDLGFRSFRDEIYWHTFSPSYDTEGAHLPAKLDAFLKLRVARPLITINGNNPRIPNASPPTTDAARAAFASYAQRAVGATRQYQPTYEIWNEWNRTANPQMTAMRGRGAPDDPRFARNYVKLANVAVAAIKERYPKAKVLVGGAATDWDWEWMGDAIDAGVMKQADGLSVHVYNQCYAYRRGADDLLSRLNDLQKRARGANGGRPVSIYVTEWGWSTGQACPPPGKMVINASSQFLFATAATPWMGGTWQYELKDKGTDPKEVEDHFGVVDVDFRDKPSTCAIRQSLALLNDVQRIGKRKVGDNLTVVYGTRRDGNFAVVWSNSKVGGSSAIIGGKAAFEVQEICGKRTAGAGNRWVEIGRTPTVIHFGKSMPALAVNAR